MKAIHLSKVILVFTHCKVTFRYEFVIRKMITSFIPQVHGIALSPGSDQVIIIKVHGNDLVICLHNDKQENRVSELMGLLVYVCKRYLVIPFAFPLNQQVFQSVSGG